MKTTIDISDSLLLEAKSVALRRRTTLRSPVESALRRELLSSATLPPDLTGVDVGPNQIPCLKSRGANVTSERIYQMLESEGC
jgi:hypothetical protein